MNLHNSKCPHCGQQMRVENISIIEIMRDVGLHHFTHNVDLDFTHLVATRNGVPVQLTKKMWYLLATLISAQGEVIKRDDIIMIVFDTNSQTSRSIDTFVAEIRKRLGPIIKTHHSIGYSWSPDGCVVKYTRASKLKKKKK
jgi:DNA-binding response OmpR family regulator